MDRIDKALAVLASDRTGYEIWKATGVTQSQLSRYRSDKLKADNMTIANAIKLSKFFDEFLK